MKDIINQLNKKLDLNFLDMQQAISNIMTGAVNDIEIENFLLLLNAKGITETEISAAASVMRDKSLKFAVGTHDHIDTCGTGGSGLHTFNCSTASSFVAAASGASVTKHGNRAVSSKSGSADFLTAAGANIAHDREKLLNVFDEVGFVFLFAPLHHDSMKYVMPVRQKIAKKTIFNLLGPHTNPCGAKRQIIGVYDQSLVETFSSVAKHLDMNRVLIVHGEDGLDEITITGKTFVSELKNNEINNFVISPKDFGLSLRSFEEIAANSPEQSLELVNEAFSGKESAVQDMIALNAGAAIYLANKAESIKDGIEQAFALMNNGEAANKLNAYIRASNQ